VKNTALATIANVQKSYRKERYEFAKNATKFFPWQGDDII
jgi:hypothetical protein